MNLTNFTERIVNGLNNPACDFYTGAWLGGYMVVKLMITFIGGYIILKFIDKLFLIPFLDWCKNKIYNKKVKE